MKKLIAFTFLLCFAVSNIYSQQLPNTNLYVFDLTASSDTTYALSNPKYLSNFNPYGYNNQPHFASNELLLLTVQFPQDTTQTDIYSLNLATRTKTRITATVESEYSPTLVPMANPRDLPHFSTIRVESDGNNTQRLWKFPLNLSNNGQPLMPSVTDVGYHCWINPRELALFIVGEPHQLATADVAREDLTNVTANIGRCIQKMPRGNVAFVHKISANSWLIKSFNNANYRPKLVTATLKGSEDFVVLADGTFIAGRGSKLYKFNKSRDIGWVEIADLSYYDITDITRLAVNLVNDKIAIISK